MVRKIRPKSIMRPDDQGQLKEYISRVEAIDRLTGTFSPAGFGRNKELFTPYYFDQGKLQWYAAEEIERAKNNEFPISIYTRKANIQLDAGLQSNWSETLRGLGYQVNTIDCAIEDDVLLHQEAITSFGLDPNRRYLKRSRKTYADNQPICWWYTCYASHLIDDDLRQRIKALENIDVRTAIEERNTIKIVGGYEFKSARVPTPEERELLQMGHREAVLILERTALTDLRQVVFYQYMVLHGLWFKPMNWYDVKPVTWE
jgi:hypothetical protein